MSEEENKKSEEENTDRHLPEDIHAPNSVSSLQSAVNLNYKL